MKIVGVVYAHQRFDGVVSGFIRRDGANAARVMAELIAGGRFAEHVQLVMLQGIAVGGFNVVDVFELHRLTSLPVLVVSSRQPNMNAVRDALLTRVRGGRRKWSIIKRLGAMELCAGVWVQRVGLTLEEAEDAIRRFAINGRTPEPLRVAHLIASGTGSVP